MTVVSRALRQGSGEHTLEKWPNSHQGRDYFIHLVIPEFTCLCPLTGLPDFATITVDYNPSQFVVELKSLKQYIQTYRDRKIGHEEATNVILDDLVALLQPQWIRIVGDFAPRGNIQTIITAEISAPTYIGARPERVAQ